MSHARKLLEALSHLASMYNQYCPPPAADAAYKFPGHMFMSAGEDTEDFLFEYGLIRRDDTAIDPLWKGNEPELSEQVKALLHEAAAE